MREAIGSIDLGANLNADVVAVGAYGTNDRIEFAIPGAGVHTITVVAVGLPPIIRSVTIDGFTQTGASPNTNPIASGPSAGRAWRRYFGTQVGRLDPPRPSTTAVL